MTSVWGVHVLRGSRDNISRFKIQTLKIKAKILVLKKCRQLERGDILHYTKKISYKFATEIIFPPRCIIADELKRCERPHTQTPESQNGENEIPSFPIRTWLGLGGSWPEGRSFSCTVLGTCRMCTAPAAASSAGRWSSGSSSGALCGCSG